MYATQNQFNSAQLIRTWLFLNGEIATLSENILELEEVAKNSKTDDQIAEFKGLRTLLVNQMFEIQSKMTAKTYGDAREMVGDVTFYTK